MRILLRINVLIATLLALLVVALVATATSGGFAEATDMRDRTPSKDARPNTPPARPAWIKADGSVDASKFPKCIKAVGQDGRAIVKGDGEPLCVPRKALVDEAPPKLSEAEAVAAGRSAQAIKKAPNGGGLMIVEEKRPRVPAPRP